MRQDYLKNLIDAFMFQSGFLMLRKKKRQPCHFILQDSYTQFEHEYEFDFKLHDDHTINEASQKLNFTKFKTKI